MEIEPALPPVTEMLRALPVDVLDGYRNAPFAMLNPPFRTRVGVELVMLILDALRRLSCPPVIVKSFRILN